MKKIVLLAAAFAMFALLAGCTSGASQSASSSSSAESETSSSSAPQEPLNLDGEWKQVNGSLALGPHKAVIAGDAISIYWVNESTETESLYWAGSYTPQVEPADTWEWTSVNDHGQTDTSLYSSSDDTKDFKYENGQIVYKASALGSTQTVRLERVS